NFIKRWLRGIFERDLRSVRRIDWYRPMDGQCRVERAESDPRHTGSPFVVKAVEIQRVFVAHRLEPVTDATGDIHLYTWGQLYRNNAADSRGTRPHVNVHSVSFPVGHHHQLVHALAMKAADGTSSALREIDLPPLALAEYPDA